MSYKFSEGVSGLTSHEYKMRREEIKFVFVQVGLPTFLPPTHILPPTPTSTPHPIHYHHLIAKLLYNITPTLQENLVSYSKENNRSNSKLRFKHCLRLQESLLQEQSDYVAVYSTNRVSDNYHLIKGKS